MSTLSSADLVQSRSSTRVHNPPGGRTTISFGDDVPPVSARTPVPAQTQPPPPPDISIEESEYDYSRVITPRKNNANNSITIGVAIADSTPLRNATVTAISDVGANISTYNVSDILSLPFAVNTLMDRVVNCVIVLGQLLETESWCSREIVQTVHSSLISLSVQRSIPIVFGLNYERIPVSQYNPLATGYVKSALMLCAPNEMSYSQPPSSAYASRSPNSFRTMVQTNRSLREEEQSQNIEPLLAKMREELKKTGVTGICGLARKFRIADADESGSLDRSEVMKIFSTLKMKISEEELDRVVSCFDTDGDGKVSYNEFLTGVRGPMNERRMKLVLAAFGLMDKNKDGVLDSRDLKTRYDVSRHPGVMGGQMSKDEAMQEFLSTFDVHDQNGKVTPSEWCEYYSNVSASIDQDDYFELMMRNTWKMSGGDGFTANTANRRVLVTHADGRQTVEEIRDDLGMSGNDVNALAANLKKQGISANKIDLYGSYKTKTKAKAPSSSLPSISPNKRQAPGGKSNLVLG